MDAVVKQGPESAPATEHDTEVTAPTRFGLKHWVQQHFIFALTVVLPTLVAGVYYGAIASDVYVSESRFLVRSSDKKMQPSLVGEFLQGTGLSHSEDDSYSVRDFILSRDALKELDHKLGVRESYSSPT